jgi:hypothetical protein
MDIIDWINHAIDYLLDWDFSPDSKAKLVHSAANFIRDDLDYWCKKTIPEVFDQVDRDWRLLA